MRLLSSSSSSISFLHLFHLILIPFHPSSFHPSIIPLIIHSSFIIHHSSFIIHHSSFIIHHSSFIIHHSFHLIIRFISSSSHPSSFHSFHSSFHRPSGWFFLKIHPAPLLFYSIASVFFCFFLNFFINKIKMTRPLLFILTHMSLFLFNHGAPLLFLHVHNKKLHHHTIHNA